MKEEKPLPKEKNNIPNVDNNALLPPAPESGETKNSGTENADKPIEDGIEFAAKNERKDSSLDKATAFAEKILGSKQFALEDILYIVDGKFVFLEQKKSDAVLYAKNKKLDIYMVERYSKSGSKETVLTKLNKE